VLRARASNLERLRSRFAFHAIIPGMSVLDDTAVVYRPQRGPPSYFTLHPECNGRMEIMSSGGTLEERKSPNTNCASARRRERAGAAPVLRETVTCTRPVTSEETMKHAEDTFVTDYGTAAPKALQDVEKQEQTTPSVAAEARLDAEAHSRCLAGASARLLQRNETDTQTHDSGLEGIDCPKSPEKTYALPSEKPDPDDALLPQGTRVRIIGNNRTKPKWIGLEGSIESGAPIGGWHVICLDDGRRIRVQRNAIQAIDIPTGAVFVETAPGLKLKRERSRPRTGRDPLDTNPSSPTFSAVTPNHGLHCSPMTKPLLGSPVLNRAKLSWTSPEDLTSCAPPMPSAQHGEHWRYGTEPSQQVQRPEVLGPGAAVSRQEWPPAEAATLMRCPESPGADSLEFHPNAGGSLGVTISRLNAKALRRYSKRFGLPLRSDVSRAQLVHEVQSHFTHLEVDEAAAIRDFLLTLHKGGNYRDQQKLGPTLTPTKRTRPDAKRCVNHGGGDAPAR